MHSYEIIRDINKFGYAWLGCKFLSFIFYYCRCYFYLWNSYFTFSFIFIKIHLKPIFSLDLFKKLKIKGIEYQPQKRFFKNLTRVNITYIYIYFIFILY